MTTVGVKIPSWDLAKSQFAEADSYPLMSSPGPVLTIIATYLVFVQKIGPAIMSRREPFKLTKILLVYNAIQVIISAIMFFLTVAYFLERGMFPEKCVLDDKNERQEVIWLIWLYFAAKLTELFDTFFFILRKKYNQITFLHLYHHSTMVLYTWAFLKYCPSDNAVYTGCINSLVHVLMYTYYALAALPNMSKYLWWKKYMTTFQLIQFVTIIIQYTASLKYSACPPPVAVGVVYAVNTGFILLLFLNFYRQSYVVKKPAKANNCQPKENGVKND